MGVVACHTGRSLDALLEDIVFVHEHHCAPQCLGRQKTTKGQRKLVRSLTGSVKMTLSVLSESASVALRFGQATGVRSDAEKQRAEIECHYLLRLPDLRWASFSCFFSASHLSSNQAAQSASSSSDMLSSMSAAKQPSVSANRKISCRSPSALMAFFWRRSPH